MTPDILGSEGGALIEINPKGAIYYYLYLMSIDNAKCKLQYQVTILRLDNRHHVIILI